MASSTGRYRTGCWPVVLVCAACSSGTGAQAELPENPIAAGQQRVLDATHERQQACQVADLVDHIHGFIAALNAGEAGISEAFFTDGRRAEFNWLSFTDRDPGGPGHFSTFTPDSINAYFATRHGAGDRFAFRGAKIIGGGPEGATMSFSPILFDYYVQDPATGSMTLHYGFGKGGYHCESGLFTGMSLAGRLDGALWDAMWSSLQPPTAR